MYSSIVDCVRKSFDYKVIFCLPCNTAAHFCWNCRYIGTCIYRSYEYNSRSCKPSSICRKMRCTNDSNRRFVCRHTSLVVYRNNYSMLIGIKWDNFRSWGSCVCPRVCTELDHDEVSCIHLYNHSRVGAEGRALLDSVGLELDLSNSQGVVEYLSNSAHLLG